MVKQPYRRAKQTGFTLVELVMVIILLGIVGTFTGRFISSNVTLYQTSVSQNERLNDARFILNRLDQELNSAIAFSLTVDANNRCIRFVPFTAAGQYIGNVAGNNTMSLIMDPSSRSSAGVNTDNFVNQRVSVLTTDANSFYQLPKDTISKINSYTVASGANPTQAALALDSALTKDSPVSRYFIFAREIRYCLDDSTDGSMNLFRQEKAVTAAAYDSTVLMLNRLSGDSSMNLSSASQFSHAILDLNFGLLLRDGSELQFAHQLVMNNVP
jgi:MSHA biogenesis protein MshO